MPNLLRNLPRNLPRLEGRETVYPDHLALPPWRLELPEGAEFPPTHGLAYYEPHRDVAVCYPIPFNVVIGGVRTLLWWLRCPPWRSLEWRRARLQRQALERALNHLRCGIYRLDEQAKRDEVARDLRDAFAKELGLR